ncbi:sensor histidine kinase [uncultured Lutibacter sp.]|uniref:sensor histidine kinase n=1 Tax=uncultured Lutibacter sp. TaxID=437739 RepID=UPI002617EE08|nr:histidine kinase [uncultured Lutibacter sp.]
MRKYIDTKLLKILILFYTATSLISLFKIYYLKTNSFGYEFSTWKEILLESILLDWVIVLLFMSIIAMTTKLMILKKYKWKYIVAIHSFFSLFIGFVIYFSSSLIFFVTGQIELSEINVDNYLAGIVSVIDLNFLIYFSMISIVYSYYYFQQTERSKLEKAQLSNQLTNAKLNILKYKLHPHFLFNTLNSISSLIETNTKLAQDTVADFGDLLRDLLDLKDTSLIPLEEELKISKRYLDIMALRFSDNLKITVQINTKIQNTLVPSLILLPIIENSIKHGYSYNTESLTINISIKKRKSNIVLSIENDGAPLKNVVYGNGIKNTIDRLKIIYGDKYKFSMKNNKNLKGITTSIIFPDNN